jgi:hypothetical protein
MTLCDVGHPMLYARGGGDDDPKGTVPIEISGLGQLQSHHQLLYAQPYDAVEYETQSDRG